MSNERKDGSNIPESELYEEIEWPRRLTREAIKNDNNFEFIKFLCSEGEVIEWNPDMMDGHYPLVYLLKNVPIRFLPTSGKVKLGEIYVSVPTMAEKVSLDAFTTVVEHYSEILKHAGRI